MSKPLTIEKVRSRVESLGFGLMSSKINNGSQTRINVKCRCGKIFNVSYKHLTDGHTKSCGCLQRKDLTGRPFGKLTVVKQIIQKERSYGARWWLCKCVCGGTIETITASLLSGATSSCGCSRVGENNPHWKGYKNISGRFWAVLKASAKKRELEMCLTKEQAYDVLEKQGFRCALSKVPIHINGNAKDTTASIDRIDSTVGYVPNNIQWVHKNVNTMKWDLTQSDFLAWCKRIAENN